MSHLTSSPTVYHLISRFVGGEWFIESDLERDTYRFTLGDALRTSDWTCIAYAVMSNHIHLGMIAGTSRRSTWLRNAHAPFGEWINRRRERFGSVFAKGVFADAVDPAHVKTVLAYIHNNPVRAGIERTASDSTWTSHRAYMGICKAPAWLDVERGLELMDMQSADAFDQWVRDESARPRTPRPKRGRPKKPSR